MGNLFWARKKAAGTNHWKPGNLHDEFSFSSAPSIHKTVEASSTSGRKRKSGKRENLETINL
jgi:hypothetical protein